MGIEIHLGVGKYSGELFNAIVGAASGKFGKTVQRARDKLTRDTNKKYLIT